MVNSETFHRLLTHNSLRVQVNGNEYWLYRGDQLLTVGKSMDAIYDWMRSAYGRLPDIVEIHKAMARELVEPKQRKRLEMEQRKGQEQALKKHERAIERDRKRLAERYPWLK